MTTIDSEAESFLRALSDEMVRPEHGECLPCFLNRMLDGFGCDTTLRFALWYRDARAPRATALHRTLGDAGGYCDCEVLMNATEPAARLWTERRWVQDADGYEEYIESEPPSTIPPCHGVRAGSVQPCGLWTRYGRRGRW